MPHRPESGCAGTAAVAFDRTKPILDTACGVVEPEAIVELVNRGVLKPTGGRAVHWRFSSANVSRAYTATRLQKEFGMNAAGVAYTMELLDMNEALRTRLRELERMLDGNAIGIGY
ncbi:MAG: chaperone modulator CbpM [Gammaproteobacteria bacterium]